MTQALHVLVYSEDRQVLAHLSRLLVACGHGVRQAADRSAVMMELESFSPHVLLVDIAPARPELLDVCRAASLGHAGVRPYIMVLCGDGIASVIRQAWEAGADDFLRRPVVYGELLARLRFAARALEFERRVAAMPGIDPSTGLLNRAAFSERVQARLSASRLPRQAVQGKAGGHRKAMPVTGPPALPSWIAIADVDRLSGINRRLGWPAGDAALRRVAELLVHQGGQGGGVASFGAGRFAILLENRSPEDALAWAESIRTALAAGRGPGDMRLADAPKTPAEAHVAVSIGLAPCQAGLTAEEVIDRAEQALGAAKAAGRNLSRLYGEAVVPPVGWTDYAAGRLFDRTRACDVMALVTRVAQADDPASEAWTLLKGLGMPAVPVVEPNGKLAGLVLAEHVPSALQAWEGLTAGQIMERNVPLEDETAPFERLREFFTGDTRPAIVIQRAGRPVGLVTADCLAALGVPVGPETFATAAGDGIAGLAVPDLRPLAAE